MTAEAGTPSAPAAGRLAGVGVVVAGGSRGIGAGVVRRFAAEGARVVVLDVNEPVGLPVAGFVRTDVSDEGSVAAAFAEAAAVLGTVRVTINSAGIHHLAPVVDTDLATWRRIQDVNATGTFLLTREAGRHLAAVGGGGRVLNIASMAAKQGGANEVAYAASKAAVVAVSRVAALEWGCHGVTVNAICPGYVPTEMGADTRTEEDVARWSALSPLGRLGTPDDVAGLLVFLASEEGSYFTGQAFNVTGGMAMH
ncbi:SDR family oxidoreductase [Nocardioides sp. GY 10127]|uniref:SDR family NAD(P)-dependent oxidoreductase n=1 Tax=Nocardioides sp. GY 10127 TaxID=2569762 RepID=UPI0010A77AE8|nr:SDR family oxidoreductase [Nocardioides sp. GY 10127]TIC81925.1 SDR family oxidoreductase [Nocardioides sp. GY 10127]